MYAQIYAESSSTLTKGKTMRVWSATDGLGIEVAEDEGGQVLRITARCWDRENSGERGGEYNPIARDFVLNLKKDEVEKLVLEALAKKLFDAMNIPSLARLEKIDQLENGLEQLRALLQAANSENEQLRRRIARAARALK